LENDETSAVGALGRKGCVGESKVQWRMRNSNVWKKKRVKREMKERKRERARCIAGKKGTRIKGH